MERSRGPEVQGSVEISPELLGVIEVWEILERIKKLLNWLIEAGPGADPQIKAAKRAIYNGMLQMIGIEPLTPMEDPAIVADQLIELERFARERAQALGFNLEEYSQA